MPVTDDLRRKLAATDLTLYRVAKDTKISWQTLKRFVDGAGIQSDHIDTLAAYLGMSLVDDDAPKRPAKKSPKK